MATTVTTLKGQIQLDTSQLRREGDVTAKEFTKLKRTLRSVETDEEKLRKQTELLTKAQKAGTITMRQKEEALTRLGKKYKSAAVSATRLRKSSSFGGAGFGGAALGMARGALPAVGGAMAVGGLARGINNQRAYATALGDTSDRLGINIADLQVLQEAAQRTSVSTQTLEMALQRSTRRISEAAQGTGEAVKALAELGLDASKLAKMDPARQFREIAGAMNKVGTQGDRVRLAMKLFDSEGVALVNTLRLGEAGLADIRDELGNLVTQDDVAQARALNDEVDRLNLAWTSMANILGRELLPTVTGFLQIANSFFNGKSLKGHGAAIANAYQPGTTGGSVLTALNPLAGLATAQASFNKFGYGGGQYGEQGPIRRGTDAIAGKTTSELSTLNDNLSVLNKNLITTPPLLMESF